MKRITRKRTYNPTPILGADGLQILVNDQVVISNRTNGIQWGRYLGYVVVRKPVPGDDTKEELVYRFYLAKAQPTGKTANTYTTERTLVPKGTRVATPKSERMLRR